jgi:hypothetical protein
MVLAFAMAGSSYLVVGRRAGSSRAAYKHHPTNSVGGPALSTARAGRTNNPYCLTVRVKPAQKKRKGRNPATGEEIMIAAKPASVDLRARPLAKAKAALPSVQKARRRLAA